MTFGKCTSLNKPFNEIASKQRWHGLANYARPLTERYVNKDGFVFKALKKKNIEYSQSERKSTAIVTCLLFMVVGYVLCSNSGWFNTYELVAKYMPYLFSIVFGVIAGYIGYKLPKIIHITLFMLPLMLIGN
jgi:hypothetical protein